MNAMKLMSVAVLLAGSSSPAVGGEADVIEVKAALQPGGTWRFDVTVAHADAGWDHYADRWEVIGPDGSVLATRVLLHPHETEQPFTRSLDAIAIPAGTTRVTVRAHDKVHGYGGTEKDVVLAE